MPKSGKLHDHYATAVSCSFVGGGVLFALLGSSMYYYISKNSPWQSVEVQINTVCRKAEYNQTHPPKKKKKPKKPRHQRSMDPISKGWYTQQFSWSVFDQSLWSLLVLILARALIHGKSTENIDNGRLQDIVSLCYACIVYGLRQLCVIIWLLYGVN